jgi:16S rRNA (adenine1518-N6/adenine1519-N6)-dimethyltransferase
VRANTDYSLGHLEKITNLHKETLGLLRRYRIFPKKHLGQNFVIDNSLLQIMTEYGVVDKEDTVLEVGAGLGFLTCLLSLKCKRVIAVEIDSKLITVLRERLSKLWNIELVESDVLTAKIPSFDKIVSTPPYSISSPLLFWLLKKPFQVAVLAFQEEFAKRLKAVIGSKDYSRLTVATYYRADIELLDHIPKSSFYPSPDVDSVIVRIKPKPPPFKVKDEKAFFQLVQTAFTQRNKKLRNAALPFLIKQGLNRAKAQMLADSLTFQEKRVRELAPEDFGALTNEILEKTNSLS